MERKPCKLDTTVFKPSQDFFHVSKITAGLRVFYFLQFEIVEIIFVLFPFLYDYQSKY